MEDAELERIRNQRLAQLQSQYSKEGGDAEAQRAKQEQAKEETKHAILSQILDQQARARLNTLLLGKPEKGQMVEAMLLNMARSGRIAQKISEPELIQLLESIASTQSNKTSVKFDRRRAAIDSDDDDF
ncbi:programmed cell death protein 5 [Coccinella septempunctata]|uniref:programmed cell death protein 5 n=1 Tax=Coccinella septempunctata TaxID=41139 RepID=UPI001D0748CF|nr:programmed cell death protein 5 [Coccinella septempunctata]